MLDKGAIGRRTEPVVNEVEKGAVRRHAETLGLDHPIHLDEAQARAAGFDGIMAPFTFPQSFRSALDLDELFPGGRFVRIPWEETLEVFRPICTGDRIHVVATIANRYEKESPTGPATILVVEEEGRDDEGRLVFRAQKTIMVREAGGP